MLESHDPNWEAKADKLFARLRELAAKDGLTSDEVAECQNLAGAAQLACDAALHTPADLIRRHLYPTLCQAEREGIWVWVPRVSPDVDLDATKAEIQKVSRYVEAVRRERLTRARFRRAGMKPDYLTYTRSRSMLAAPIVLAMLRYRIARRWFKRPLPGPV